MKRSDAALQDLDEKQNSKKEAYFQGTTKNSDAASWKRQGMILRRQASIVGHLISLLTNFASLCWNVM
ncbi:hypothetical protein OROHE_025509 [Orobanche hederae]